MTTAVQNAFDKKKRQVANTQKVRAYLKECKDRLYVNDYEGYDMEHLMHIGVRDKGTYMYEIKLEVQQKRKDLRFISPILNHFAKHIYKDNYNARVGTGEGETLVDLTNFDIDFIRALLLAGLKENEDLLQDKAYLNTKAVLHDTGERGLGACLFEISFEKM